MGIAVFSGMIGVTLFGLFLTPVFLCHFDENSAEEKNPHATKSWCCRFKRGGHGNRHDRLLFSIASANASWFTVGPELQRPSNSVPADYKALILARGRTRAAARPRAQGQFGGIFGDTNLNTLEPRQFRRTSNFKAAVAPRERRRATRAGGRMPVDAEFDLDSELCRAKRFSPQSGSQLRSITANTFRTPVDFELRKWYCGAASAASFKRPPPMPDVACDFYTSCSPSQSTWRKTISRLPLLDAEIATV